MPEQILPAYGAAMFEPITKEDDAAGFAVAKANAWIQARGATVARTRPSKLVLSRRRGPADDREVRAIRRRDRVRFRGRPGRRPLHPGDGRPRRELAEGGAVLPLAEVGRGRQGRHARGAGRPLVRRGGVAPRLPHGRGADGPIRSRSISAARSRPRRSFNRGSLRAKLKGFRPADAKGTLKAGPDSTFTGTMGDEDSFRSRSPPATGGLPLVTEFSVK